MLVNGKELTKFYIWKLWLICKLQSFVVWITEILKESEEALKIEKAKLMTFRRELNNLQVLLHEKKKMGN